MYIKYTDSLRSTSGDEGDLNEWYYLFVAEKSAC